MKLSVRTRVSLPRAMAVVTQLPCLVKSGLNAAQANRLKNVLEEIGGRARIETHLVTPSETSDRADSRPRTTREGQGPLVCPACGGQEPRGASYRSFCYRKFPEFESRPASFEELLPETNPLEPETGTETRRLAAIGISCVSVSYRFLSGSSSCF